MISMSDVSRLLSPHHLKRLCQSLAMLDAIVEPAWDLRYFSFDNQWADGKSMASMRTGEGESYFVSFCSYGMILIGHTPKSPFNRYLSQNSDHRQALIRSVPVCFAAEIEEPAFETPEATLFIWSVDDAPWESARLLGISHDDYSADLLFALDGDPASYVAWAKDYFDVELPNEAVRQIYSHLPLTKELVFAINSDRSYKQSAEEAAAIGYPLPQKLA